ncbi:MULTISPECIES: NAD(P)-dependent oxidoreductase [unclassified Streptomyces]|uniref:NAD-dependent epimerase/dehydratase family protein n=1 Tax=Streptomyces sp. SID6137 TaxID=2690319 RepID=UPI00136C0135|nr:NAD-dependent epimerase/dehydratase family protein [Streptomyces sp. SID6139]MYR19871.1 NAD-dependent epimerase/dehydratase family protein [Streptomyces sp. SID6137]
MRRVSQRIVITGAAGGVGTLLRPRLARAGRTLRLLDVAPVPAAAEGEDVETVRLSVTDLPAMCEALTGVDAVIHLGGLSVEGPWDEILDININGTRTVLEAARRAGVPRVIIASSSHAVGFHPRSEDEAPDYLFPRPDTYYGVSKVAAEALGSLYHDRYGLDVVCVRIGGCFERPVATRQLATWLSPADCARLMEALIAAPSPGFRVVWGVSDNTRRWFALDEARALGYEPQDDAERFAGELEGRHDPLDEIYLGGAFCSPSLNADDGTGATDSTDNTDDTDSTNSTDANG